MLDKFERFNNRVNDWFEGIALAGMLVMMAITCIDVVGAKVFRWRLFGAIDIVMLSQLVAIAFAAGMTLILRRHIQVEFFISLLPKRVQAVIDSFILMLGLGLFLAFFWRLYALGHSFQMSGEYSATIDVPYYPFAYGIALAFIPVCLTYLLEIVKAIRRIGPRWTQLP
jgi:TRAP-type C4-dicarboxylate transport system permease small subunit